VVVADVKNDSPAMNAGIQRGDIIREINNMKITRAVEYERALSGLKKDKVLRLLVKHGESSRYVAIKVE
jgi:S1-C subfamily serine protease